MARMGTSWIQYLTGSRAPFADCPKKGIGDQLLGFLVLFQNAGGALHYSLHVAPHVESYFGKQIVCFVGSCLRLFQLCPYLLNSRQRTAVP
jgi:hypothetical protein